MNAADLKPVRLRLSASQVQTFSDCKRKWAWRYVEGIETQPNAAAALGGAVHAELQKYLEGGEIDFTSETGYIAASGLEHLPKPGTVGILVEQEFHFEGPSGHSYLGYKDLELPGIIYDHKTTSDLRWQKTAEDLKKDIQAILYATDYFRKCPNEDEVELRWVYYQTKNTKKSAVTQLRVNQTETWNRFLGVEEIAEQMSEAATKRALELPPSINHCSAYGGCPYEGNCNLSPFDKMRSHVEQNKLLASLQAKKSANGTGAASAAPGQVPSRAFAPGGAFAGTLSDPAVAFAGAPGAAPSGAAPSGNKLLARLQAGGAPAAAVVPPAINPPEYQPPPTAAAASPVTAVRATVAAASAELAESLAEPVADAAPAAEASRGRGRPKKAVVPPTGLAVKIDTLYLNCGPVGVAVVDAGQFIVLAKKQIEATGIADYRFAEYGQGPGMLAVAVVAVLDALPGVVSAVRLDTTTPEGSIVAVELMARASLVVR